MKKTTIKLNCYEYPIEDGKLSYTGSYSVKAGCKNEAKLQKQLKSVLVGTTEIIRYNQNGGLGETLLTFLFFSLPCQMKIVLFPK